MKRLLFILITLAVLVAAAVSGRVEHAATPDDKPKVEDIVAKHLQAIGKDEARAAVKSRVIAGANAGYFQIARRRHRARRSGTRLARTDEYRDDEV